MAAHPRLRAPDPPGGEPLAQAEQRGEDHQSIANDSESNADRATAARTMRRLQRIRNVDGQRHEEEDRGNDGPSLVCMVDAQSVNRLQMFLVHHVSKEVGGRDTMRGVMRT